MEDSRKLGRNGQSPGPYGTQHILRRGPPLILPRGQELSSLPLMQAPKRHSESGSSQVSSSTSSDERLSGCAYAGASFDSPPAAGLLPKPPMHWIDPGKGACQKLQFNAQGKSAYSSSPIALHLKAILKVPAQA